jgi:16S rRNA (cytosine1402-N4)-methyltransferase
MYSIKYSDIQNEYHQPVMPVETLEYWVFREGGVYVDCTMGGGGHSELALRRLEGAGSLISFDRDPDAVVEAGGRLKALGGQVVHRPFSELAVELVPNSVDGILWDLGVSSHQLDEAERGFSFAAGVELDMRMNPLVGESAAEWLRRVDEEELARVLRENSDVDKAWKIACMLKEKTAGLLEITPAVFHEVVDVLYARAPKSKHRHLARIFQAIRMEVNQEMQQLEKSVRSALEILKEGGRFCFLTYHSVEDRKVKRIFKEWEKECLCSPEQPVCSCGGNNRRVRKVVRKPLEPSAEEIKINARARSAKLRVYEKVK